MTPLTTASIAGGPTRFRGLKRANAARNVAAISPLFRLDGNERRRDGVDRVGRTAARIRRFARTDGVGRRYGGREEVPRRDRELLRDRVPPACDGLGHADQLRLVGV